MRLFALAIMVAATTANHFAWSDDRTGSKSDRVGKSRIHFSLTGKKKSDRVYFVEFEVAAKREEAGAVQEIQQIHTSAEIPDGQALRGGGLSQTTGDPDGTVVKKILSFELKVSSINMDIVQFDVSAIHRISGDKHGAGSRVRTISLEGIEDVRVGKTVTIVLGTDANTGMTYTVIIKDARLVTKPGK